VWQQRLSGFKKIPAQVKSAVEGKLRKKKTEVKRRREKNIRFRLKCGVKKIVTLGEGQQKEPRPGQAVENQPELCGRKTTIAKKKHGDTARIMHGGIRRHQVSERASVGRRMRRTF